jgi:CRP-like cAMP-binding protein
MSTTQPTEFRRAGAVEGIDTSTNSLLAALRDAAPQFRPHLEIVRLRVGDLLVERGTQPSDVYFPLDSVLSMLTVTSDERLAEFATIGREGMSGVTEVVTGLPAPMRVIAQVPGSAARASADELAQLATSSLAARRLLDRHVRGLLVQAAQIAACNRLHPVEERCARWLLMTHDRAGRDEFLVTQEFLALMLGVRRARVNVAAGILQRAGYIRYTRGRMRLTDRVGLEQTACECYGVITHEYKRLNSGIVASQP